MLETWQVITRKKKSFYGKIALISLCSLLKVSIWPYSFELFPNDDYATHMFALLFQVLTIYTVKMLSTMTLRTKMFCFSRTAPSISLSSLISVCIVPPSSNDACRVFVMRMVSSRHTGDVSFRRYIWPWNGRKCRDAWLDGP